MFLIYFLIGQQFALQLKFLNVKLFFQCFYCTFMNTYSLTTHRTQNGAEISLNNARSETATLSSSWTNILYLYIHTRSHRYMHIDHTYSGSTYTNARTRYVASMYCD